MTSDINTRGATPDEWYHFDFVLGLGGNLLPCVPAGDDVRVLAGSALEGKVGKIPSQFNRDGLAHGLPAWQKRPILSNELQIWQADQRLNICVRTGPISGVYALDVDIDELKPVEAITDALMDYLGPKFNARYRSNSHKFLVPFLLTGGSCKKRKIKLDQSPRGPAIELLADGQQFVAAGSHSSGARYQWSPRLPDSLPTLTLAQLDQLWETLTATYAADGAKSPDSAKATSSISAPVSQEQAALTSCSEDDWSQLLSALRFLLDKVQSMTTGPKLATRSSRSKARARCESCGQILAAKRSDILKGPTRSGGTRTTAKSRAPTTGTSSTWRECVGWNESLTSRLLRRSIQAMNQKLDREIMELVDPLPTVVRSRLSKRFKPVEVDPTDLTQPIQGPLTSSRRTRRSR